MNLDLDVTGAREASGLFGAMARRARDPRPAWPMIAAILAKGERAVFATRGASLGTPWRRRRDGTPATLRQSGALAASLTRIGTPGQQLDASRTRLRFGTGIYYARFVARDRTFVGASRATRDQARSAMAAYILHGRARP